MSGLPRAGMGGLAAGLLVLTGMFFPHAGSRTPAASGTLLTALSPRPLPRV